MPNNSYFVHDGDVIDNDLISIADLTPARFRILLLHFSITVKDDCTVSDEKALKKMLQLLPLCSPISATFSQWDPASLLVRFQKDTVVNVFDPNKTVALYPLDCEAPCVVCNHNVVGGIDKQTGQGFECSACYQWFHNSCLKKPIGLDLYNALESSPDFIRVFCPRCLHNGDIQVIARNLEDFQEIVAAEVSTICTSVASEVSDVQMELAKLSETVANGFQELHNKRNAEDVSCDLLQTTIEDTCKSVTALKDDVNTNVSTFGNSLDMIVGKVNQLDNIDFNAIASAASKVANDVSNSMNRCILLPNVVTAVSDAVAENLVHKTALTLNHSEERTAELVKVAVREEVSKLNTTVAPSRKAVPWEGFNEGEDSSVRTPTHYDISSSRKTVSARTKKDDRSNSVVMDPSKTVSIGNAHQPELSSSAKIKSVFNEYYKRMEIVHCKRTMNGFILVEVDTAENAQEVVDNWKGTYFADGNSKGMKITTAVLLQDARAKAVIRDVEKNLTDQEMTDALQEDYPGAAAKRLSNKNGLTYSVLISFKSKADLMRAQLNHVFIYNMCFRTQDYNSRPRIIQCFSCNRFGHIAPTCNRKRSCAFCSGEHKEADCEIKKKQETDQYKCSNCGQCHTSFDRSCETYKKLLQSLPAQS